MNKKQINVIMIAGGIIGVLFLFPPWASLELIDTDQGQALQEKLSYL